MLSQGRDLEQTREALEAWLGERLPGDGPVSVSTLVVPGGTGFSNETLMFEAARNGAAPASPRRALVARIQTTEATVFPDLDVVRQARVMQAVRAHSDVPVPEVLWVEDDPAVLGTPFFVMEKVNGVIPTDVPSYNEVGFVADMPPPDRRMLWESAIDKLARVHAVDWRAAGLDALDNPSAGASALDQHLGYLRRYADWAVGDHPFPVARRAWEWLEAHRPADPGPAGLCWGDARFSNMIFSGVECVGVLDWEMALLCPPERDLGWWLYFDRFSAEGYGVERLEGLPGRAETIEHFEALAGRPMRDLEYWEVVAGYYFVIIMVRVGWNLRRMGLLGQDAAGAGAFEWNNPACDLLARVLEEYA